MGPEQLQEALSSNPLIQTSFKEIDDSQSDFSKIDDERELWDKENILDLIINQAEILESGLIQVMDKSHISQEAFNTFISLEFYDHGTKVSEIANGFWPNYAT